MTPTSIRLLNNSIIDLEEVQDGLRLTLEDIAIPLGHVVRWSGAFAPSQHFSVAEHCVQGAELMLKITGMVDASLLFLHHDDEEAIIGDIPGPLKEVVLRSGCRVIDNLAKLLRRSIWRHLNLPNPDPGRGLLKMVKAMDEALLVEEYEALGGVMVKDADNVLPERVTLVQEMFSMKWWPAERATDEFIRLHHSLKGLLQDGFLSI
jgi:hypothetical protein